MRAKIVYLLLFSTGLAPSQVPVEMQKAADKGNAESQDAIGYLYLNGKGVPLDYGQAMHWFKKAADQGNAEAQDRIGFMYALGDGVPQDFATAMEWFKKAADQGYAKGQINIGVMYDKGEGVAKDYAKAIEWYKKAADQGNAVGQINTGSMYQNGEGVPQDYGTAMKWYKKAADQGAAIGQIAVGLAYFEGHGVPKDYGLAKEWFKKAADQGDSDARNVLASMTNDTPEAVSASPPAIGQNVSVTLADGTVKAGKLVKIDPEGISILTDDGGGKVLFAKMTPGDQQYFGFDQDKLEAYETAQETAKKEILANRIDQTTQTPNGSTSSGNEGVVASFSGASDKNTESFLITSDKWKVTWKSTASTEYLQYALFAAEAVADADENNYQNICTSKIGPGGETTVLTGAGKWRLKITSVNANWSVVVSQ